MKSVDPATGESSHPERLRDPSQGFQLGGRDGLTAGHRPRPPVCPLGRRCIRDWNRIYPLGFERGLRGGSTDALVGVQEQERPGLPRHQFRDSGQSRVPRDLVADYHRGPAPGTQAADRRGSLQPGAVVGLVVLSNLWAYLSLAWFQISSPRLKSRSRPGEAGSPSCGACSRSPGDGSPKRVGSMGSGEP